VLLGGGNGTFLEPRVESVGRAPLAVVAADLNDDGQPDVAVANEEDASVSLKLSQASGGFLSQELGASAQPAALGAGDLDGDGQLDLAVANRLSADVSVLLNRGAGVFEDPTNYATGVGPGALVIADLDGDGLNDVATADQSQDYAGVSVLLNLGGGALAAPVFYPLVDSYSHALVAVDLDGDGSPELVVADESAQALHVLHNRGDGRFAASVDHYPAGPAIGLVVADLNGDGAGDLAVANAFADPNGDFSHVMVFLNAGKGRLAAGVPYALAAADALNGSTSIVAADFDGDGSPDLAIARHSNATVSILTNQGDGTFGAPLSYAVEQDPSALATADFNSDQRPDLAVTSASANRVSLLLNGCIR
jgi:hypothetical protein